MSHCDPELLAARVQLLEEAVRTLQRSNAELLARMDALLNPTGQFSGKNYSFSAIIKIQNAFKQGNWNNLSCVTFSSSVLWRFGHNAFIVSKKSTRGPNQQSRGINRPLIDPPPTIEELAEDLVHLDFNNGAQAQAPVAPRSSGEDLSDWLQIQVTSAPPGISHGASASSSSGVSLAAGLQSRRPGILIRDSKLWRNGYTLLFLGDAICYWAETTCYPGCEATKACHFSSRHSPKFIWARCACAVTHKASFNKVLDLPR